MDTLTLDTPLVSSQSSIHSHDSLESGSESYEDFSKIEIISQLGYSKFPVYLMQSLNDNQYQAIKIFPYKKEEISPSYLNEKRFSFLSHKNIVKFLKTSDFEQLQSDDAVLYISYVIMELASRDFADIIKYPAFNQDEKLVRTYFHQLVEGMEYLHSLGISHLDIKLENLLLGKDFQLKITDFDMAHQQGDKKPFGQGSLIYRAPEVRDRKIQDPTLSDVYSMGIVLFILRIGHFPYLEKEKVQGFDLYYLLHHEPENFWKAHKSFNGIHQRLSNDFKDLFIMMTREDPAQRITLAEIKRTQWYNGPIYSQQELPLAMKKALL